MRRRHRRGAATLETAAALPFLVLLVTASADYAWLALVQHQMNHAARSASRFGITGQGDTAPSGKGAPVVRLCNGGPGNPRLDRIRAIVSANSGGVLKPRGLCLALSAYAGFQAVGRPEPFADINGNGRQDDAEAFTDINGNGQWDADQAVPSPGGSDQIAIYTLRYVARPLTGLTPGLGRDRLLKFETRVVVRNEPF